MLLWPGVTMCTAPVSMGRCINSLSGLFQGNGTDCNPNPCLPTECGGNTCFGTNKNPMCCLADSDCDLVLNFEPLVVLCLEDEDALNVKNAGGCCLADSGEGSPCACPSVLGACCDNTSDGCFDSSTPVSCSSSNGAYQGDGTDCNSPCPTPPTPPPSTGACCVGTTCNPDFTPGACGLIRFPPGGEFQGLGTDCNPDPCLAPTVCEGNTCSGTSSTNPICCPPFADCAQSVSSNQVLCLNNEVASNVISEGGCCQPDGSVTGQACFCSIAVLGACCLPDDSCANISQDDCDSQGGIIQDSPICAEIECGDQPPNGPEEPTGPIVIIPTIGQWGIVIASLILGLYAVIRLRNIKDSEFK